MQNASMPNVLIRDLPEATHRRLTERAARAGQSLQQYLRADLVRSAERETVEEVFERVRRHRGGRVSMTVAAEGIRADRDSL